MPGPILNKKHGKFAGPDSDNERTQARRGQLCSHEGPHLKNIEAEGRRCVIFHSNSSEEQK